MLQDNDRNIDNHNEKGNEVDHSEDTDYYILMSNCGDKESHEECGGLIHFSSSHWEVHVSYQEAVNWEVPFSPILRQIPSIPKVTVESSVSKFGDLSPHIKIAVK